MSSPATIKPLSIFGMVRHPRQRVKHIFVTPWRRARKRSRATFTGPNAAMAVNCPRAGNANDGTQQAFEVDGLGVTSTWEAIISVQAVEEVFLPKNSC
jgi:hypothetical protein